MLPHPAFAQIRAVIGFGMALAQVGALSATGVLSFEEPVPPAFLESSATSTVQPTAERAKYGRQSLRWTWQPGDVLTFRQPIAFKANTPDAKDNALSSFVVWIYSPVRRPAEKLRFQFGRGSERDCWFDFGLDFTGWRTCWVAFERDMQGRPQVGMDTLRILAPGGSGSGTLFIDSLVFSQPIDARHHIRDRQVPFVSTCLPTDANDHWQGLYRFALEPLPAEPVPAGAREAAQSVARRYEQLLGPVARPDPGLLASLRQRFATWQVRRTPSGIRGRAIAYPHEKAAYPADSIEWAESGGGDGLQTYAALLYDVAQACRGATDEQQVAELRSLFFDLTDHLIDQGWAEGSGMGTLHHLGYSTRQFYAPFYLMRDALRATGRLDEVQRMLSWFSGVGKAYIPLDQVNGISIDTLNTTVHGQIASQLLLEDETQRSRALAATSRWLGRALEPCHGLNGGIQADGSVLHHGNHYPAYAEGGIMGASQALWLFSNTALRVPEPGHASLRRAMLNLRFHSNVLQWPLSLSGRHPNATFTLNPEPYLFLALAGSPDGREPVDREVAAAWRRLADARSRSSPPRRKSAELSALSRRLMANPGAAAADAPSATMAAIAPEAPPTGHLTMSYATTAAHRRADWLVTARGFSRYLWGSEIYPGANIFGRYLAYGHVEILAAGDPINLFDSGFSEAGWDWNCWPGTTTLHLPLDLLRDRVNNVDRFSGFEEMLISDEAFAGGSNLGGRNGIFAMKLHEHAKYDGSHRARKSVFFFNDHVVLLGSGITNTDREHATRTTLFQQHIKDRSMPVQIDADDALSGFPAEFDRPHATGTRLVDTIGNAYYLLSDSSLHVTKSTQASRSQNDKQDTAGDFVLAWLDHGCAPGDEGYAYAILIRPSDGRRRDFTEALRHPETSPFTVIRRDQAAHIVEDRDTGIIAAACFEPIANTGLPIDSVDTPALVMLSAGATGTALSVCDPDLHLYSGTEADQYYPDGRQREVSIYSRSWFRSASLPSRVRVTLVGDHRLAEANPQVTLIASASGHTTLEFTCRNGLPIEIRLLPSQP